jgi:hypothetical protein
MSCRWKQWFAVALLALPVGCQSGGSGSGQLTVEPPKEAKTEP